MAGVSNMVGELGPYRTVHLSRIIDPANEKRRCRLHRRLTEVLGVSDYHTDIDIVSHLGTHVEAPSHHATLTKDVTALPVTHYAGRGVLLNLSTCRPGSLITTDDLDAADGGKIRDGDVVILDSPYHSPPFEVRKDDSRPHLSRESAEWFVSKGLKAVGFGDGISIERNVEHCIACHDVMLANDVLFIEVMENIDQIQQEIFFIIYLPLPIRGLDSSPVSVLVLEGVPGFGE